MSGYTAYIDESGDDGFNFDDGSSDFIVLGAIVARTNKLDNFAEALRRARSAARKSSGWVFPSFKKLNNAPAQRWLIASCFADVPHQTCCVLVYKRGLTEPGWERNKEDLYFHASKFLLERVSWACRDTNKKMPEADLRCRIVFSRRGGLRYENFQRYVRTLASDPVTYGTKAEWSHIDPDLITWEDHSDENACHLAADHFTSAIGCAVERKDYGQFDDRYARIWHSKIYHFNNKREGNGFKIWPESGTPYLKSDPRGFWFWGRT